VFSSIGIIYVISYIIRMACLKVAVTDILLISIFSVFKARYSKAHCAESAVKLQSIDQFYHGAKIRC